MSGEISRGKRREGGASPGRGTGPLGGKQHKHRQEREKARCMWPGDRCARLCSPTEARASPALWVIPGLGGSQGCLLWSGTPIGSADHLTRSPGSGFILLHCWGRCSALGGLQGCWVPAVVKAGHNRDGPGTQEDSKCQAAIPWAAQGPTEPEGGQANTQPGHLGAWTPLEASR